MEWPDEARGKIAKLIRMLGSGQEHERLASLQAIDRILQSHNATWHDLAALMSATDDDFEHAQDRDDKALQRKAAQRYLKHPNFADLPQAWQEVVRQVARDGANAYENNVWDRICTQFSNWERKAEREERKREWEGGR